VRNETPPRPGRPIDSEQFKPEAVLITPKQFGPRTRTPVAAAIRATSRCNSPPRAPVSAKPPLMTTATVTCAAPQSAKTSGTAVDGVTTSAKSTGSGTAARRGYAGHPRISLADGWMAITSPRNPASAEVRLRRNNPPALPWDAEAPMTATRRGVKRASGQPLIALPLRLR
jgi:hypothetical protein